MEFKFIRAEFYHEATNSCEDNVYVVPEEYSDMEVDKHIYPDFDAFVENIAKEHPNTCLEDCQWDWYEIDMEELRAWCIATATNDDEASKMYYEYCAAAGIPTGKRKYHVHISYNIEVEAFNEDEAYDCAIDGIACKMYDPSEWWVSGGWR